MLHIAGELDFVGVSLRAGLLRAPRAAARRAIARSRRGVASRLDTVQPADMYLPEAWRIGAQVYAACRAPDEAAMAVARGAQWIRHMALPNVPDSFCASFGERNPTNRALLAPAGRAR